MQILITTRNRAFHALYQAVDTGVFTPGQVTAFLHERTDFTGPGAEKVAPDSPVPPAGRRSPVRSTSCSSPVSLSTTPQTITGP
ncbi:hypothetical protein [Herbidospora daliensis]|uniref:hypothetical protein n=1 Tax=Herbidospora daliensis TaxID=295585 RepID=UPI00078583D9|nr:hypothetical protein [Herbidospora daliensis]